MHNICFREDLTLDGIKQYYVDVEKEQWKFDCLLDIYDRVTITQAIVFCNSRKKVTIFCRSYLYFNHILYGIAYNYIWCLLLAFCEMFPIIIECIWILFYCCILNIIIRRAIYLFLDVNAGRLVDRQNAERWFCCSIPPRYDETERKRHHDERI